MTSRHRDKTNRQETLSGVANLQLILEFVITTCRRGVAHLGTGLKMLSALVAAYGLLQSRRPGMRIFTQVSGLLLDQAGPGQMVK